MGKKHKRAKVEVEESETEQGHPDDLLIPHTFEQTFEMAFAEKAVIIITLDRPSGSINIDQSLSTPMETWAMLDKASDEVGAKFVEMPLADD